MAGSTHLVASREWNLAESGHGPELEEITGFDEGPRPADWKGELETRGIHLAHDILRDEAIAVYKEFRERGRLVYAPRQDPVS